MHPLIVQQLARERHQRLVEEAGQARLRRLARGRPAPRHPAPRRPASRLRHALARALTAASR